jgi:outer membrane protein assembly factor BamE (lipoprotein component of BamABCDE complex)
MLLAGLILAVGGCASYPSGIATGMTHAEVLKRFGTPAVERPTPDGDLMIYATAPMGQYAYAAVLDRSERVVEVAQILTPENFARIQKGQWDAEEVLQHFGPPAARHTIRGNQVWDYRYKEYNVYNSLFSITFDASGLVAKTENGPDWLFDGGRDSGGHHK